MVSTPSASSSMRRERSVAAFWSRIGLPPTRTGSSSLSLSSPSRRLPRFGAPDGSAQGHFGTLAPVTVLSSDHRDSRLRDLPRRPARTRLSRDRSSLRRSGVRLLACCARRKSGHPPDLGRKGAVPACAAAVRRCLGRCLDRSGRARSDAHVGHRRARAPQGSFLNTGPADSLVSMDVEADVPRCSSDESRRSLLGSD
jgi:hypothetical protein